jgi:hypothetical protein
VAGSCEHNNEFLSRKFLGPVSDYIFQKTGPASQSWVISVRKECERKRTQSIVTESSIPGFPRKETTGNFSQCPGQGSKWVYTEYGIVVSTLTPR